MRFALHIILLALLAALVLASAPQKQFIVSYPKGTPDSVVQSTMNTIKKAGGVITHEYNFIKAFAATFPEKLLETVKTMGAEYNAIVEEDQMVGTLGGGN